MLLAGFHSCLVVWMEDVADMFANTRRAVSESLKSAMRNVFKVKVAPFKRCWLLTLIYTQTTQMCNKPAPYGEDR